MPSSWTRNLKDAFYTIINANAIIIRRKAFQPSRTIAIAIVSIPAAFTSGQISMAADGRLLSIV